MNYRSWKRRRLQVRPILYHGCLFCFNTRAGRRKGSFGGSGVSIRSRYNTVAGWQPAPSLEVGRPLAAALWRVAYLRGRKKGAVRAQTGLQSPQTKAPSLSPLWAITLVILDKWFSRTPRTASPRIVGVPVPAECRRVSVLCASISVVLASYWSLL
jgi:hypothetical protein